MLKPQGYSIYAFLFMMITGLFVWSCSSHAAQVEITIGQTYWQPSDNGTWWETPFKREWPGKSQSWSLGYTGEFNSNLAWHVGYANLGTVTGYGEAVGDDVYGATNGCTTGSCPSPDKWYGKGMVDGVYATIAPQITFHNVTYSVEAGVWNYEPRSIVYVPLQHPCGLCNPSPQWPNQYFISRSDRMWGQVFGIGISYKNLFIRGRMYWVDSGDKEYPAIYQGYTSELAIGWRFK